MQTKTNSSIPTTSSKQYDRTAPKRKRKDVGVKTETYLKHKNIASTKRQKTSKQTPSSKPTTKLLSNKAKKASPTINESSHVSSTPKQSSITSYLGAQTKKKPTILKVEQFFKVPDYSKGFNLLSLRRH